MDRNGWIALTDRQPTAEDCVDGIVLMWHVYQGVKACGLDEKNRFYTHWRKPPTDGWISAKERRPEARDGDVRRCVLALHDIDGIKVTGWHQFAWDTHLIHWMRTPHPPTGHLELIRQQN